MKPFVIAAISVLIGCLPAHASAQDTVSPLGSCKGVDLRGRTIRDARLEDPFWILRWRRPGPDIVNAVAALKGKPYAFETVNAVSKQIESKAWVPDNASAPVQIHYSDIGVADCQDQHVDVVFTIISASVPLTTSTLFEWGSKDKTPNQVAGLERQESTWHIAPEAVFDRARLLTAGGHVQAAWSEGGGPFRALMVRALGSSESHVVSASLTGGYESPTAWLRAANWRILLDDASTPTGSVHLDERTVGVQFSGTSRPLNGVVTRFAGMLDGGRLESGFAAGQLPEGTLADTDYKASRLFVGVTGHLRHQQSYSASYGITFGSTGSGFHGDWRKHIGDLAHEFWQPIGDHRLLELDQRLTLGRLQSLEAVPATERFFGGASNDMLVLGDDWRLPIAPRVRSIPTNRLSLSGAGGDHFVAYNSTTAFTVWRKPAVPAELLEDNEFNRVLDAQLKSARSTLDVVYQSDDPSFKAIKDAMPDVVAQLRRVEAAETAARSSGVLPVATFRPCERALQASRTAANHVSADKPLQAYGWVQEMLPGGNNALTGAVDACGADLIATLKGAGIATADLESASKEITTLATRMADRFASIDTKMSAARANSDMAYAGRALDIILKQLNITSFSPVFVFDVAHVGPAADDPFNGDRYAIGGGVRFTLASTVNMTLTYAANPRRQPGEGAGALVFSLTTRNLFD